MEPPVLKDPTQFPTDEIVFSHIGRARTLWEDLFAHIKETYPGYTPEWRYYKDGYAWLLKVCKKSKTLCWVSLVDKTFRATFYFGAKAQKAIAESALPADLKEQHKTDKKIRGITIVFKSKKDLAAAKTALALKEALR